MPLKFKVTHYFAWPPISQAGFLQLEESQCLFHIIEVKDHNGDELNTAISIVDFQIQGHCYFTWPFISSAVFVSTKSFWCLFLNHQGQNFVQIARIEPMIYKRPHKNSEHAREHACLRAVCLSALTALSAAARNIFFYIKYSMTLAINIT